MTQIFSNKVPLQAIGWGAMKPAYKQRLEELVQHVHWMTTHMYQLVRFVFVNELDQNPSFNIADYIDHSMFNHAFLAFDGSTLRRTKAGGKNQHVRDILMKHSDEYRRMTGAATVFDKPKFSARKHNFGGMSTIANCVAKQAVTNYNNIVSNHFGDALRHLVNLMYKTNDRKKALRQSNKWATKHEFDAACKEHIWEPLRVVKAVVQLGNIDDLDIWFKDELQPVFQTYGDNPTFQKESVYYDVKVFPKRHLHAYYHVARLQKLHGGKGFECLPQCTEFSPAHMLITTEILIRNVKRERCDGSKIPPIDLAWKDVVDLDSKPFRPTTGHQFSGTVYTDGVSISILMDRGDLSGPLNKLATGTRRDMGQDEFTYVEDLKAHELEAIKNRVVFIDPGRRDLLFCLAYKSTPDDPRVYRYTSNQRAVETGMRGFGKLRNKVKPDSVHAAEAMLGRVCCRTLDPLEYRSYLFWRSIYWDELNEFYGFTETLGISHVHENKSSSTESPPAKFPLFRRLKLSTHINQQQADFRLAKKLREIFGPNPVLIFGDWSATMTRYHEPIRGIGMLRMLRNHDFTVYLLKEFRTSTWCPACESGLLTKCQYVENPQEWRRGIRPFILCHGLLCCSNRQCLQKVPGMETTKCRRLYNRDLAAVLNFRHIFDELCATGQRPERFQHSAGSIDEIREHNYGLVPEKRGRKRKTAAAEGRNANRKKRGQSSNNSHASA